MTINTLTSTPLELEIYVLKETESFPQKEALLEIERDPETKDSVENSSEGYVEDKSGSGRRPCPPLSS